MYAALLRGDLHWLAKAESSYYSAHRVFTVDLDSLRTEDGRPFRMSTGNSVNIGKADSAGWEAVGKSLVDSTITCSIGGSQEMSSQPTCNGL